MDTNQIQKQIDDSIDKAMAFNKKKVGDTPTDAFQLVNKKYVDSKPSGAYAGYVNSDGSAGHLPTGWSSSHLGTGAYEITHNLGTANYAIVLTSGIYYVIGKYDIKTSSYVDVYFQDRTGTLIDNFFNFILIPF